jgi:hypothetical protein
VAPPGFKKVLFYDDQCSMAVVEYAIFPSYQWWQMTMMDAKLGLDDTIHLDLKYKDEDVIMSTRLGISLGLLPPSSHTNLVCG